MSDKDLIQEAIDYARRYWQHGSETRTQYVLKVLADALEARQVDEAGISKLILKSLVFTNENSKPWADNLAHSVVEFLGERHEPEPIRCDYCGDDLPSVKHRSHLPTTPDLQRRGFAADKIVCGDCAKSPSAPQPSESLVCEPRQDSMLLWEGTSSATAPANEYGDAEESEAEYKNHAATVTSEPTDAQIEAGLKKVDWDAIRAGEADPEEAAGVAVRAALEAAARTAQGAAPQAENADCDRDRMGICKRCGMGWDARKVLDGDFACPVLPGGVDEDKLAEVERAAAEKAWGECDRAILEHIEKHGTAVDEEPWPVNPYRKEQGSD